MFTDLNFLKEERDEGINLISAGNMDGFEELINEHPACNSIFGIKNGDGLVKSVSKLVKAGNKDRAQHLFKALYEIDFNFKRKKAVAIIAMVIVFGASFYWFITSVWESSKADARAYHMENIKTFKKDCINTGDALGVESKIVEVRNGRDVQCWFKQNGSWKIQKEY